MRILFHFALLLTLIASTGRAQSIVTVANFDSVPNNACYAGI